MLITHEDGLIFNYKVVSLHYRVGAVLYQKGRKQRKKIIGGIENWKYFYITLPKADPLENVS